MAIILGVDPGPRLTGYGVIRQQGNQLSYLGSGCINAQGTAKAPLSLADKLKLIHDGISEVIVQFQPDEFAIDHIQSINDGGSDDPENLQCVHPLPNKAKGTMSNQQFISLCKAVAEHAGR